MISPVKLWRNQKQVRDLIGRTGMVVTWTQIRVPPAGFSNQAPYTVALIELADKKRVICQMVDMDPAEIAVDFMVRLTVRVIKEPDADGVIIYGIKAAPVNHQL